MERSLPVGSIARGFVDADGDYYIRADAYWRYCAVFGEATSSVRTCVLRVRKGEAQFDPEYFRSRGRARVFGT
jgi:hypothetical protein